MPSEETRPALLLFLRETWYHDDPSLIVIYAAITETLNQLFRGAPDRGEGELLGELVKHRDPHVRLMAAYQLGRGESEGAVNALLPLLDSPRYSMRAIAALGLGKRRVTEAIPILKLMLEERELDGLILERETRQQRQELDYYYNLLEPVEPVSQTMSPGEKKNAIVFSYLLAMQSPEILPTLASHCADRDPATVMTVLKSIAASRDISFIPALIGLKGTRGEVGIQQAIDTLLRRQPDAAAEYISSLIDRGSAAQRMVASRTWAEVKELQKQALKERFLLDTYWPVRYWAMKSIAAEKCRPGEPGFERLIQALDDPSYCVRTLALQALEASENIDEYLRKALDDRHFSVRTEAGHIAASKKCKAVEQELIANLEHPSYAVRMSAARALGELKSRSAFPRLKTMLKQCTLPEKIWLYFALTLLTGEKKYWIFAPFLNLPEDDRPEGFMTYRCGAGTYSSYNDEAFASMGKSGFRAGPIVSRAEFDELLTGEHDFLLRLIRSLDRIYIEKISERKESLFQAIEALGALAVPETIAMLGDLMKSDREKAIKMAVIRALVSTGRNEAFTALIPGLADNAPEVYVKTAQVLKRAESGLIFPHLKALLEEGKAGAKGRELIAGLMKAAEKHG